MKKVGDLLWSPTLCFAFFSCIYCLYSYSFLLNHVFYYVRPFLFLYRTLRLFEFNICDYK